MLVMMTPGIMIPSIIPSHPHCEHFLIGRGSAFSFLTFLLHDASGAASRRMKRRRDVDEDASPSESEASEQTSTNVSQAPLSAATSVSESHGSAKAMKRASSCDPCRKRKVSRVLTCIRDGERGVLSVVMHQD
jgi:anti-sigma28 factor (negative regulator of flagellin synthesis)